MFVEDYGIVYSISFTGQDEEGKRISKTVKDIDLSKLISKVIDWTTKNTYKVANKDVRRFYIHAKKHAILEIGWKADIDLTHKIANLRALDLGNKYSKDIFEQIKKEYEIKYDKKTREWYLRMDLN